YRHLTVLALVRGLCRSAFFFQAEDGIRDFHVTGVQTCALPIFPVAPRRQWPTGMSRLGVDASGKIPESLRAEEGRALARFTDLRSEERRVGKEWRCWGSPEHERAGQLRGTGVWMWTRS